MKENRINQPVNTQTKHGLPTWAKGGILGAVILLVIYIGLIVLQSLIMSRGWSYYNNSKLYEIIHSLIYWIAFPVLFIFGVLFSADGCEGMAYILPIFISVFIYLAAIGFAIGSALTWFLKRKSRKI